jgi:hypothetical protein
VSRIYRTFNVAIRLKKCQDTWDDADRDTQLSDALKMNQRIWNIIQVPELHAG